jgi:flagellar hook protein FlgE
MPLSSINIGSSGLIGFSKQLETISNNVANLNTPGFKGATSQFSALFSGGGESAGSNSGAKTGAGMAMLPSAVDFAQGQISQTGSDLDVAIDGRGFFVLKDDAGNLLYTRDGRFSFNDKGLLVNTDGAPVQSLGNDGALHDISLEGVRTNPASSSTTIKLGGTLSTADTTKVVSGINVTDAAGGTHTLSLEFKNNTSATAGSWTVTVKEGATTVATGDVRFASGLLDPAYAKIAFTYSPAGVAPLPLSMVLDAGTTSAASGSSTLAVSSVDGWGVGTLTNATFDASGKLSITYSNGQKAAPQTLALANFGSTGDLEHANGTSFRSKRPDAAVLGMADGTASSISPESLEGSNVDLSRQFSAIIVTQRGYQASSELISTANQMLDTLMHMKG